MIFGSDGIGTSSKRESVDICCSNDDDIGFSEGPPDPNAYINTIIDAAIRHYYNYIINEGVEFISQEDIAITRYLDMKISR